MRMEGRTSDVTQRLNFFASGRRLEKIRLYRPLSLMMVISWAPEGVMIRPPFFIFIINMGFHCVYRIFVSQCQGYVLTYQPGLTVNLDSTDCPKIRIIKNHRFIHER